MKEIDGEKMVLEFMLHEETSQIGFTYHEDLTYNQSVQLAGMLDIAKDKLIKSMDTFYMNETNVRGIFKTTPQINDNPKTVVDENGDGRFA